MIATIWYLNDGAINAIDLNEHVYSGSNRTDCYMHNKYRHTS